MNDDIIDNVTKCFKYAPIKDHPWITFMKENLQENEDYVIVDRDIW